MLPAKEEEEAPSTKPKDPEEEIRSMKDGFLDSEMMSLYVEKKASIEVTTENYKNVITGIGKAVMEKFGGPQQYLEATVGKNRQGFLEYLQATYIPRMDVHYVDGKLPMDTNTIVSCHVWDLGFSTGTSTKPPIYQQTANLLLDEILTNGFVSQHDPLLVWEGLPQGDLESQENGSFKAFWLSYVKGAARSTTVLFLCQLLQGEQLELGNHSPRDPSVLVLHLCPTADHGHRSWCHRLGERQALSTRSHQAQPLRHHVAGKVADVARSELETR